MSAFFTSSSVYSTPSSAMSLQSTLFSKPSKPFPPPQPRGIDFNLPTCGEIKCNGHGTCVAPPGGGAELVCNCELGYRGEFCNDTVNGALSLPLTLSVLAVIFGLLILAFLFAKIRQTQKKRRRRHQAAKHGYNIVV